MLGKAPEFTGIDSWLNTPGDQPLTLRQLRGKVVLVDFWTYSCINCIRTLPHLRAWYAAYHRAGLEIVGVHTPEFAFEHVRGNVKQATHDLHVTWPVALDNGYKTWDAYSNQYWPAEYLVRPPRSGAPHALRRGRIRRHRARDPNSVGRERRDGPGARHVADATPTDVVTPETYVGYARIDAGRYSGSPLVPRQARTYALRVDASRATRISFGGDWTIGDQRAVAGPRRTAAVALPRP